MAVILNNNEKYVELKLSGVITNTNDIESIDIIKNEIRNRRAQINVLYDCIDCNFKKMTNNDLKKVAEKIIDNELLNNGVKKIAFITDNDVTYEMLKTWKAYLLNKYTYKIDIFKNHYSIEEWKESLS